MVAVAGQSQQLRAPRGGSRSRLPPYAGRARRPHRATGTVPGRHGQGAQLRHQRSKAGRPRQHRPRHPLLLSPPRQGHRAPGTKGRLTLLSCQPALGATPGSVETRPKSASRSIRAGPKWVDRPSLTENPAPKPPAPSRPPISTPRTLTQTWSSTCQCGNGVVERSNM